MHVTRNEQGQATLELALCLPVVVILVAMLLEVGLLIRDDTRLWHAAREAARTAVVGADEVEVERAAELVAAGAVEVRIDPAPQQRQIGEPVEVTLVQRFAGYVPLVEELFRGVVLSAEATMRVERI